MIRKPPNRWLKDSDDSTDTCAQCNHIPQWNQWFESPRTTDWMIWMISLIRAPSVIMSLSVVSDSKAPEPLNEWFRWWHWYVRPVESCLSVKSVIQTPCRGSEKHGIRGDCHECKEHAGNCSQVNHIRVEQDFFHSPRIYPLPHLDGYPFIWYYYGNINPFRVNCNFPFRLCGRDIIWLPLIVVSICHAHVWEFAPYARQGRIPGSFCELFFPQY